MDVFPLATSLPPGSGSVSAIAVDVASETEQPWEVVQQPETTQPSVTMEPSGHMQSFVAMQPLEVLRLSVAMPSEPKQSSERFQHGAVRIIPFYVIVLVLDMEILS